MTSVDDKIREYGQKRDTKALKELVQTLQEYELVNIVKTRINSSSFSSTLLYILQSFSETQECHQKRFKLVLTLLKELEKTEIPPSRAISLVQQLCTELHKVTSEHVVELCQFCLECIQSKNSSTMWWKDLMPELLNVLVEREQFVHDELEYTGAEYKSQFISTLCMTPWTPDIITSLTSAFIDMPLTKEEHLKVVNKLGQYIEKLTPQEIPSFVYQLLQLCKHQNSRAIFLRLQNYFALRIYNNAKANNGDSSSENSNYFDAIESTNDQDCIEAESTVLYHVHSSAAMGHGSIKDYLNSLKNLSKAPEAILQPFQLMVLFTISTVAHYEDNVFDIIRPCIVKSYQEEQKQMQNFWFRDMVPNTKKVEKVFNQVVQYSLEDRELVLQGLVNFAFVLLNVGSALGRDVLAEKQWQLGNMILLKIIKRKRHIAPTIIQTISNRIVAGSNVAHYIECVFILSRSLPLLMLENTSCVVELMEGLVRIPGNTAFQLVDAIIPLTKFSPTIRDHLILLLRKSLYSRVTETRQTAVIGFLKMLTTLKISNLAALSQSSDSSGSFNSGHSLFTQISINKTNQGTASSFSNEALCLEVLSILKRCFMQQVEVRMQLYEGLYEAVGMNPELGIPILDVIWLHFSEFYILDEEELPPLDFKKIAELRETDSVLKEPLGKLVYVIGLITTKVQETDKENLTVVKFNNFLNSMCQRLLQCQLVHFKLENSTDLLDVLPESQQKMHILKETMNIYEALIGYKIVSWTPNSENQGRDINNLFLGYTRLSQLAKNLSRPKKGENKRKNSNKSTQQSNSSIKKSSVTQKGAKVTWKQPDTILDFQCIEKALDLLHSTDLSWTSVAEANVVKTKREIHRHFMQATITLVQKVKNCKVNIDSHTCHVSFDHLTRVATILYSRIVKRLAEFIDFDCPTAILAMECFQAILIVIQSHFKSNLQKFLCKVAGGDTAAPLVVHLTEFVETYQKLFELDEEEATDDPEIKKLSFIVVNTLTVLANQIPSESSALSIQFVDWLKMIAYKNTLSSKVANPYIHLLLDEHIKYKMSLTLLEQLALRVGSTIGVISEEEKDAEGFKVINEATVHTILLALCSCIKSYLEDIDAIIARLKSEFHMISYPGEESVDKKKESLNRKEKGVSCQLCFIVTILTTISNIAIQPGTISDAIFKNLTLAFCTMSSLSKYFMIRSSKQNLAFQGARFERLVKLAGKQLAPVVYKLILHIEENQKQDSASGTQTTNKKKTVDSSTLKSKVLKETRLIPKLVFEIEQFSKCVTQLSNKTKVDLAKYVGQGTVRDFRILQLKEVLEQVQDTSVVSTQATDGVNVSVDEEMEAEEEEEDILESTPPPTKKSKK